MLVIKDIGVFVDGRFVLIRTLFMGSIALFNPLLGNVLICLVDLQEFSVKICWCHWKFLFVFLLLSIWIFLMELE
jgi:hypothetical protein